MGLPGGRSCLAAAGRASDGLKIQSGEELPPSPKDREQPGWGGEPGTGMPVTGSVLSLGRVPSGDCSLLWMAPSAALQPAALHPSVLRHCLHGEPICTSVLISSLLTAGCGVPSHSHRESQHRDRLGHAKCLQQSWVSPGSSLQLTCSISV